MLLSGPKGRKHRPLHELCRTARGHLNCAASKKKSGTKKQPKEEGLRVDVSRTKKPIGVAKGSSISCVAKFKGDKNPEQTGGREVTR